jgi:hypothetical protein
MKITITDLFLMVVLLVWMTCVGLGMYDRSYKIPGTVELAMASAAGYLLGNKYLTRGGETKEDRQKTSEAAKIQQEQQQEKK